jgi:PAS domain S-box-containing protein
VESNGDSPGGAASKAAASVGGRRAWIALPVFAAVELALGLAGPDVVLNPPFLLTVLNVLFLTVVSLLISFLAARSFLTGHPLAVLLLGCGTLALGLGGALAAIPAGPVSPNRTATTYNTAALLAALFHLLGTAGSLPRQRPARRGGWAVTAALYTCTSAAVGGLALAAAHGVLPVFFREGEGATLAGRITLLTTAALFVVSGVLLFHARRGQKSGFTRLYTIGLGLLAVGLLGVSVQTRFGSPLNWTARASQYAGCLFFLAAVVSGARERGEWTIPLEQVLRESELRYETLLRLCPDAVLVHAAGRYIYANAAAARLFAVPAPAAIVGLDVLTHVSAESRSVVAERIRMAYAGAVTPLREVGLMRPDGTVIDVESTSARVELDGKPAILLVIRDVTQRKAAQAALLRAKEDLEKRVEERTRELTEAVAMLTREIARRREAERSLHERQDRLRSLATELTLAEHRQRQQIAQQLHDNQQQLLAGARYTLEDARCSEGGEKLRAKIARVDGMIAEALDASRLLTADLSPPIAHNGSLFPVMKWLGRWMEQKHGLTAHVSTDPGERALPEEMIVLLYQSVRELLFNVVKHAEVGTARVEIRHPEGFVEVTVQDEGRGFEPPPPQGVPGGGLGLFSIGERLGRLGGQLIVDSSPGSGSRVTVRAPLP